MNVMYLYIFSVSSLNCLRVPSYTSTSSIYRLRKDDLALEHEKGTKERGSIT